VGRSPRLRVAKLFMFDICMRDMPDRGSPKLGEEECEGNQEARAMTAFKKGDEPGGLRFDVLPDNKDC
jgi:hypothetical protein